MLVFLAFIMMMILLSGGMILHLYLYKHGALNSFKYGTTEESFEIDDRLGSCIIYKGE